MRAVVLFAHGSRDPRWREPLEAVARRMAELDASVPVGCAYLELMQPGLAAACRELVARGATAIHVVPMFLGMGRHVREDLPRQLQALRSSHPDVAFSVAPAVGERPEVIDLLAAVALGVRTHSM